MGERDGGDDVREGRGRGGGGEGWRYLMAPSSARLPPVYCSLEAVWLESREVQRLRRKERGGGVVSIPHVGGRHSYGT